MEAAEQVCYVTEHNHIIIITAAVVEELSVQLKKLVVTAELSLCS